MPYSTFQEYLHLYIHHIDLLRMMVIAILSLAFFVFLLIRNKTAVYASIALALSFFFCLFLVDSMVLIRFSETTPYSTGFDFQAEFNRIFHSTKDERAQILFNVIAFVPLGFFLSEFYSTAWGLDVKQIICFVLKVSLGLSVCIEALQLFFHLGLFELTDMVMNTFGALIGASVSISILALLSSNKGRF